MKLFFLHNPKKNWNWNPGLPNQIKITIASHSNNLKLKFSGAKSQIAFQIKLPTILILFYSTTKKILIPISILSKKKIDIKNEVCWHWINFSLNNFDWQKKNSNEYIFKVEYYYILL